MSGDNHQFSQEHLKKMAEGVRLFNGGFYWECHEELEDHWLTDLGDDVRYVYWVVIQVATALLHHRDGNLAGAKGMIAKAQEKVAQCEARRVESDILYRFLGWKRFKVLIKAVPKDPKMEDFAALRDFKFSDPRKWGQHLDEMEEV